MEQMNTQAGVGEIPKETLPLMNELAAIFIGGALVSPEANAEFKKNTEDLLEEIRGRMEVTFPQNTAGEVHIGIPAFSMFADDRYRKAVMTDRQLDKIAGGLFEIAGALGAIGVALGVGTATVGSATAVVNVAAATAAGIAVTTTITASAASVAVGAAVVAGASIAILAVGAGIGVGIAAGLGVFNSGASPISVGLAS